MLKVGDILKYVGKNDETYAKVSLMTVTAYHPDRMYGIYVDYHSPFVMPDGHIEMDDIWRTDCFDRGELIIFTGIDRNIKKHTLS